jgi:mono/diheme cytochrome c family protein
MLATIFSALLSLLFMSQSLVWADSSSVIMSYTADGDAERGRTLFNGKGICSQCHGIDGHPDQRPDMTPYTAEAIARLDPPPADLRNPTGLQLKTDQDRFDAIRHGHLRTAMFAISPTTLTDDEIRDLVAYLSSLRHEACATVKECHEGGEPERGLPRPLTFYDAHGEPAVYTVDGTHLYLFSGEAIAYVHAGSIYSFNGRHLGWFANGWVWDHKGDAVLSTTQAVGGPVRPKSKGLPMVELRLDPPRKVIPEAQGSHAGFSNKWSSLSPLTFFGQ